MYSPARDEDLNSVQLNAMRLREFVEALLDKYLLMSPCVRIPARKSSSSTTIMQFWWLSLRMFLASLRVVPEETFT